MGYCIIPRNVGYEGSLYNVASTYKIPNYPHALSPTVCGNHKWAELPETLFCIFLKKMRIAVYQLWFYSNKVEGFTTSRSLRVYILQLPHTHKNMNKLEDLKVLYRLPDLID